MAVEDMEQYRFDKIAGEQQVEIARKGAYAAAEAKKEKKLFKEAIEKQLGSSIDDIINALIDKAKNGDVTASTFLRDTFGEKPIDKVQNEVNLSYEAAIKEVTDDNEY